MKSNLSLDRLRRPHLRQVRAMGIAHEIAMRIEDAVPRLYDELSGRERRHIFEAVMEVLMAAGAEVITDHDRQEAGLPPRGPDGWTHEELIAMERKRLELMYPPVTCTMPPLKVEDIAKESNQ